MADWSQCKRLIAGEIKSFDLEKRYIRKDGQIIWIYLSCSVVEDELGKPLHFLTYIREINEKKTHGRGIGTAQPDFGKTWSRNGPWNWRRAMRIWRNSAYIASHDLQEPLRKIIVFCDRLKEKIIKGDEQGQDYLERAQKSAIRMQNFYKGSFGVFAC